MEEEERDAKSQAATKAQRVVKPLSAKHTVEGRDVNTWDARRAPKEKQITAYLTVVEDAAGSSRGVTKQHVANQVSA